ncbi:hypothetical protein OIK40_00260 [Erythrobacter sp. sf7]|uniref:Uncharacterized protein n=1 Tax=Erythrobacter fulvus TaxID=2987523 RepID=A0ABT5JN82_9SPHN|nr:hypothetical protein [Erythrobacter fulvus]MDC8753072.1 hypothetical protein [Erythrobacter fulvus]
MLGRFLFENFQKILTSIVGFLWLILWLSHEPLSTKLLGLVGALVLAGLIGWYGAAFKAWYRRRRRML